MDYDRLWTIADKSRERGNLSPSEAANLDAGDMWPTNFAPKELTPAAEARIIALVKKAVS